MEELHDSKQVHYLGVSNISPQQLVQLCESVRIQPSFVQNRCYARMAWDKPVRDICQSKNIRYQGFSLLTANQQELMHPLISVLAKKYNKTIPQIVFNFCQQLEMICLTGTSSPVHMREDLNINDFTLTSDEVSQLEAIGL